MEEWKLIATAPKDGRQIRVKRDGSEETVVWFQPFDDWAVGYHGKVGWKLLDWGPTHWKPIDHERQGL
jgi:hypothetical protein